MKKACGNPLLTMTTNTDILGRLPAEWEPADCVIVSWPHPATDWAYMLPDITACYVSLIKALSTYARVLIVTPDVASTFSLLDDNLDFSNIRFAEIPTNDTWARDFGMICTIAADGTRIINDFKFNGWGLKFASCLDNLITRNIIENGLVADDAVYANRLNFVFEGGAIDTDGQGCVLTTSECLLSPNRNGSSSKEEIERYLLSVLGCQKMLWLDYGFLEGDDTDSHVDTLARFLPGGMIAYTSCDRPDDVHYEALQKMEQQLRSFTDIDGRAFRMVDLPIPEAIFDDEGERLPATYANFLLLCGAVLLPVYGDEKYDALAIEKIKAALPLYDVVTIDCRALIQQHGSLHCATMQVPPGIIVD